MEAIRLDSAYPLAFINRANSLDELQKYDEAIADLTEAIRLAPRETEAFLLRAYI